MSQTEIWKLQKVLQSHSQGVLYGLIMETLGCRISQFQGLFTKGRDKIHTILVANECGMECRVSQNK